MIDTISVIKKMIEERYAIMKGMPDEVGPAQADMWYTAVKEVIVLSNLLLRLESK